MTYDLIQTDLGLALINSESPKEVTRVDFNNPSLNHRARSTHAQEGLLKAIQYKPGKTIKLLDTTAGLGRDAFLCASKGCEVTLLERNATMYALLQDGMIRASQFAEIQQTMARMTLIPGNSLDYLAHLEPNIFDVIYCDPMFPEKKKTALPSKEMRALKAIVGPDSDIDALIALACSKAKRVVVKRPRLSDPLKQKPSFTYTYTSCRFDVYVNPGIE